MIRQANKYDIDNIIKMLIHYRDSDTYNVVTNAKPNDYIKILLSQIIAGLGFILIAEKEKPLGMIVAMKIPNIWNPEIFELHELAYWVEPEARGGTLGYRLLKEYCNEAQKLKDQNLINFFSITKMIDSPNIKYEKFGFNKFQEMWIS